MKILILSCNTGQGHNSAGYAIKEELERMEVECEMTDGLRFFRYENVSNVISGTYIKMVSHTPKVFGAVYGMASKIGSSKRQSPVYYASALASKRLAEYINEGGYDGVIMTHVFPADIITRIKKHNMCDIRTYCVATDYTSTPLWEETRPDYFFIPHIDLINEFVEKGIDEEKLVPTGIPVSAKYYVKYSKKEAREKLGLDQDAVTYLVMTGSMGFGKVSTLVSEILDLSGDENTAVCVLTGKSEKLRAKLAEDFPEDKRVIAVPFTKEVNVYMDACDVLLSKPGGLTSTEAAVKQVPFIHSKPIPGCETRNAKFFSSHGMSLYVSKDKISAKMAYDVAHDPVLCQTMTENQRRKMPPHAARAIATFVISDITGHKR